MEYLNITFKIVKKSEHFCQNKIFSSTLNDVGWGFFLLGGGAFVCLFGVFDNMKFGNVL